LQAVCLTTFKNSSYTELFTVSKKTKQFPENTSGLKSVLERTGL